MSETLSAIMSTARAVTRLPALYVGLAGDAPRTPPARFGLGALDRVELGRGERREIVRRRADGMVTGVLTLVDSRMSSRHARLTRVGTTWVLDDLGSKNGTWIDGEPATRRTLEDGDVIVLGHTAVIYRDSGGELADIDRRPDPTMPMLATMSPTLGEQLSRLAAAAASTMPIELTGETGTGKELAARAVHALSQRPGRFVVVNCGAVPEALLEGELFGHRRGAYTGATDDRAGLVRSADGGTLFLDEIAELPAGSQAALLRVLQEGEVTPLGGDRAVKVDVRLVTATHKDLDDEVTAGRFRADLRARVLGVAIDLPPLHARLEDLGSLVADFLDRHHAHAGIAFSADAVIALYAHTWPLNVRELERAVGAAVTVSRGARIELEHLPEAVVERAPAATTVELSTLSSDERTLREQLAAALGRHAGNVAAVARELGKDPTQIRRWLKRFGIDRGKRT